jgi:uncharacterized membrane protein
MQESSFLSMVGEIYTMNCLVLILDLAYLISVIIILSLGVVMTKSMMPLDILRSEFVSQPNILKKER